TAQFNRHPDTCIMRFDRHVRNPIRKIVNALEGCVVIFFALPHAFEGSSRHYRLTHQSRFPTDWVTARVDTTNNGMEEGGAIPTALHVVFARPYHLYRSSRSLCHMNGFDHKVGLRSGPTAKPSTQEGGMDLDLLRRKACDLGGGCTVHRLELRSRPDLTGVCPQIDGAVQRLHHQMRQVRHFVNSFDLLCSLRERGIGITVAAQTLAR